MNRNYTFSRKSKTKLETISPELALVCNEAMHIANSRKLYCPDFGISHGLRTLEEQTELYAKGRFGDTGVKVTNCDGVRTLSKHQTGEAIDFYAYVEGGANYLPSNLALVATCFFEAASNLGISIDWGGSFRSISDGAHIELSEF
jgi:peptidoglycan L-alanyl-D-glutamate endopeptidase CwlK